MKITAAFPHIPNVDDTTAIVAYITVTPCERCNEEEIAQHLLYFALFSKNNTPESRNICKMATLKMATLNYTTKTSRKFTLIIYLKIIR